MNKRCQCYACRGRRRNLYTNNFTRRRNPFSGLRRHRVWGRRRPPSRAKLDSSRYGWVGRKYKYNPSLVAISRNLNYVNDEIDRLSNDYSHRYRKRNPIRRRFKDFAKRVLPRPIVRGLRRARRAARDWMEDIYRPVPSGVIRPPVYEEDLYEEEVIEPSVSEPLMVEEDIVEDLPEDVAVEPPIPTHSILVIGGDATYIPEWMHQFMIMQITQARSDLDWQLEEFEPDLILAFVRAEKPNRPTKDTIYNARNYAKGVNAAKRQVPYITINKGWSHVIQRASELGLDWFVDSYPHQIYVPEEDLQPKPKRKMTKSRMAHNKKRAERFKEKGITASDVNYATTRYVKEKGDKCSLCDTKIKYLFRLMFDRPGEPDPIVFHPVGSTCITDWMDAIPDSEGKLAFLKELQVELEKVEAIKTRKKAEAAEKAKAKRQADAARRRAVNEERKRKLEEQKQERKRQRETRRREREEQGKPIKKTKKKVTKKAAKKKVTEKKAKKPPSDKPLPETLEEKFEDLSQQFFDWE